jgi:hypothetical protein
MSLHTNSRLWAGGATIAARSPLVAATEARWGRISTLCKLQQNAAPQVHAIEQSVVAATLRRSRITKVVAVVE